MWFWPKWPDLCQISLRSFYLTGPHPMLLTSPRFALDLVIVDWVFDANCRLVSAAGISLNDEVCFEIAAESGALSLTCFCVDRIAEVERATEPSLRFDSLLNALVCRVNGLDEWYRIC